MKNTLFIKNKAELQAFLAYAKETSTKTEKEDWEGDLPLRLALKEGEVVLWDSYASFGEHYPKTEHHAVCKDHGLEYLEEFCAEANAVRWNDLKVGEIFNWGLGRNKSEYVKISESSYASEGGVLTWGSFNDSYCGMRENEKVIRKNKTAKLVFKDNEG